VQGCSRLHSVPQQLQHLLRREQYRMHLLYHSH
jgi:hypothetical protein